LDHAIGAAARARTAFVLPVGKTIREAWDNSESMYWRRQLLD
jgi:hypothetical protein